MRKALDIPTEINTRTWPLSKTQNVKNGPFPTDYWNRAYMEDIEPNETKDEEIKSAQEDCLSNPEIDTTLMALIDTERNDLKWVELCLHESLLINDAFLLTNKILLHRCMDQNHFPLAISFMPLAGMTSKSTLMALREHSQRLAITSPEDFTHNVISIFERVSRQNLHTAVSFIQNWAIERNEFSIALTTERLRHLNDRIHEILRLEIETNSHPPTQLMKLIPENESLTLCTYLHLLHNIKAKFNDPQHIIANSIKELTVPEWLKKSWFEAMTQTTTKKKAILQAVGTLFNFDTLPEGALIKERVISVFNEYGHPVLELIFQTDFTNTLFENYAAQIKTSINTYLQDCTDTIDVT